MKRIKDHILNTDYTAKGMFVFFSAYTLISYIFLNSDISAILKTPITFVNLVVIFGSLISLNIGLVYKDNKLNFSLFSIGLSLVATMFIGLILNYLLPVLGIYSPLSSKILTISIGFITILLAYILYRKNRNLSFRIPDNNFKFISVYSLLPILFLIVSSIGTSRLNSTGENTVILLLAPLISAYYIYLFISKKSFDDSVYISTIFFSALSIILTFSMRGPNIIGWDINEEFQVFSKTLENLRWSMDYYKGLDYNACISITILPTIFQVLTGISPHYIFKFFFQIFFSLLPLSVYSISNKYLSNKLSLLTAFLFISQTWFFEQMPALIRQEIAFYLYSLILIALFSDKLSKKLKYLLVVTLSFGLVISHYTTSYIIIIILGGLFAISYLISVFTKKSRDYFALVICVLIGLFVMFWQINITKTGDAFIKLVTLNERKGVDYKEVTEEFVTENSKGNKNKPSISIENIKSKLEGQPEKLQEFYIDIVTQYVVEQDKNYFNNIEAAKFIPKAVDDVVYVDSIFPDYVNSIFSILNKVLKLLMYVLAPILGFAYFAYQTYKSRSSNDYSISIITSIGIFLVSLMVAIPFLQIHYNLTRLYLQVFLTLSIFAIILMNYLQQKYHFSSKWLVFTIAFFFMFQTGFIDQFTGGYKRITLNSAPADHYLYLINTSEVYSARWLKKIKKPNEVIQADNMANLRLQSFADSNSNNTKIFPLSMKKDTFVYMITVNLVDNMAFLQYQNQTIKYEYPIDFINSNKNLIYSNQGSRIYR